SRPQTAPRSRVSSTGTSLSRLDRSSSRPARLWRYTAASSPPRSPKYAYTSERDTPAASATSSKRTVFGLRPRKIVDAASTISARRRSGSRRRRPCADRGRRCVDGGADSAGDDMADRRLPLRRRHLHGRGRRLLTYQREVAGDELARGHLAGLGFLHRTQLPPPWTTGGGTAGPWAGARGP